jgi:tetratricopeptide (TPR) repeat protein
VVSTVVEVKPLYDWYQLYKGFVADFLGKYDEARHQALLAAELAAGNRNTYEQILGWLAAQGGDPEEAARLTAASWRGFEIGLDSEETLVAMRGAFGSDEDRAAAIAVVDAALARRGDSSRHRMLPMFYIAQGAYDKGLELFFAQPDPTDEVTFGRMWSDLPAYVAFRRSERMQDFAERSGLLDYWLAYGWPDGCRPLEPGSRRFEPE